MITIYHNFYMHRQILLICLAGFLIRLLMATIIPLNFDEADNILLARSSISPIKVYVANGQAPLFFLVSHAWQKISESILWNRLLGTTLGTVSIAVTYFVMKKTASSRTANIAALLTAVTPGHVYYSAAARMYAPGILLSTLFCSYFILYLKEKRLTVGFFLVTLAGLYTHYYFFLLWILTIVLVLIYFRHNHQLIAYWLKFCGLIATFFPCFLGEYAIFYTGTHDPITIENYFNQKYHQIERRKYHSFDLIHYDTTP